MRRTIFTASAAFITTVPQLPPPSAAVPVVPRMQDSTALRMRRHSLCCGGAAPQCFHNNGYNAMTAALHCPFRTTSTTAKCGKSSSNTSNSKQKAQPNKKGNRLSAKDRKTSGDSSVTCKRKSPTTKSGDSSIEHDDSAPNTSKKELHSPASTEGEKVSKNSNDSSSTDTTIDNNHCKSSIKEQNNNNNNSPTGSNEMDRKTSAAEVVTKSAAAIAEEENAQAMKEISKASKNKKHRLSTQHIEELIKESEFLSPYLVDKLRRIDHDICVFREDFGRLRYEGLLENEVATNDDLIRNLEWRTEEAMQEIKQADKALRHTKRLLREPDSRRMFYDGVDYVQYEGMEAWKHYSNASEKLIVAERLLEKCHEQYKKVF